MTTPVKIEDERLKGEKLQLATEEFRELFAKEATENAALYNESDVHRIAEEDLYCHRFLWHSKNKPKKAFKMAKEALKWRKEFAPHDIKITDVNPECFETNGLYPMDVKDGDGHENLLILVKLVKNDDSLQEDFRKFLIYWMETLEKRATPEKGINVIFNCTSAGLNNVDMGTLKFFVNVLTVYYPWFANSIIVYDMPQVFQTIWKVVNTWVAKEHVKRIKFADKKTILELLDAKAVPDYMGGTSTYEYKHAAKA